MEKAEIEFRLLIEDGIQKITGWIYTRTGEISRAMGELRVWSISKFLEEFEQLRKQLKFYDASTMDLEILEQMVELIGENLGECPLFMLLTGVETVRLENGQMHGWTDNLRQVLQDMNINDGKS
jgi:hypothetical protein